jgi:hypothetical protein
VGTLMHAEGKDKNDDLKGNQDNLLTHMNSSLLNPA